jgi:hypothetical protein
MTGFFPKRRKPLRSRIRSRLSAALAATVVGLLLLGAVGAGAAAQPESPIVLDDGQGVEVTCHAGVPTLARNESGEHLLSCVDAPEAASNSGTPDPSTTAAPAVHGMNHAPQHGDVGACGESMNSWHPLMIDGCATGHEHGDAPPSWIAQAGYTASFHGDFNTSPTEHTRKHAGMKGFLTRFADVDIYFRVHASSNVLDRSARYHSYEVWARDPSGGVSRWQGWYNSGDPLVDRFPRRRGVEPEKRPAILVVDQTSWEQGIQCEQWYANTASWSWDFGWTICGINALYYPGEGEEQDQRFWRAPPGQPGVGTLRRLEAAWYDTSSGRTHPVGQFWATQFGEIVAGPDDPRCSDTTAKFGETYPNVCLEQYIAPTMQQVAYPNINAEQRQFDATGVQVPN